MAELAAWVRVATPAAGGAAAARTLDYDFYKARVQPMFMAKREGLVRCTQCHSRGTGSGLVLSPLAEGAKDWNDEQSRKNFASVSGLVVPGAPTSSRLLMHPLSRMAGGYRSTAAANIGTRIRIPSGRRWRPGSTAPRRRGDRFSIDRRVFV